MYYHYTIAMFIYVIRVVGGSSQQSELSAVHMVITLIS